MLCPKCAPALFQASLAGLGSYRSLSFCLAVRTFQNVKFTWMRLAGCPYPPASTVSSHGSYVTSGPPSAALDMPRSGHQSNLRPYKLTAGAACTHILRLEPCRLACSAKQEASWEPLYRRRHARSICRACSSIFAVFHQNVKATQASWDRQGRELRAMAGCRRQCGLAASMGEIGAEWPAMPGRVATSGGMPTPRGGGTARGQQPPPSVA